MSDQANETFNPQSGNAIWFILLAVSLLAALTIALTRTSETVDQTGDVERLRIQASDLMRYTKGMETTAAQMVMRGVSENDLCFNDAGWGHADYNGASCATAANRLFGDGGGMSFKRFSYVTSWDIFGTHTIQGLGTAARDLIVQAEVEGALCREINSMIALAPVAGDAPVDDIDGVLRFTGSLAANPGATDAVIGDDAASLAGRPTGCRKTTTGTYFFYHAIIER